jgi:predicted transcriptional regulator
MLCHGFRNAHYAPIGALCTQSCLVSFEKSALQWGMELFEYYKQKSKEIKR